MNKFSIYSLLFIFLVLIDQATKYFAYDQNAGGFLNSLRPVLGFQIFPNKDIAFSIHMPVVLMWVMYTALLLGLIWWFTHLEQKTELTTFGVVSILAGAISNIYDRVSLGYVRDFIFVFWGNIFNFADLFILLGIILLLFQKNSKQSQK